MSDGPPLITKLFETPVIAEMLPGHERLQDSIRTTIGTRRASDAGVIRSNLNGWQSTPDMMRWGGEASQSVGRHFIGLCDRFTGQPASRGPNPPPFLWMLDLWANVNPPGGSNNYHNHPGAVWSAVYYVDVGDEAADVGGELVFQDPRMPATRMLPLDLRYRSPEGTLYQEEHVLKPRAGMMVMFPPWLLHSVRPYRGTGERISLAMNATAAHAPRGM